MEGGGGYTGCVGKNKALLWSVHRPCSYSLGARCGPYTGRVRTLSALVVVRTPHRPFSYSLGARCGPYTSRVRTLSALVVVRTPHRPFSYSLGARCGPYTTPAVFVLSRSSLWSVHHTGRVRTLSELVVVRTPRRPCSYSLGAPCGPYTTPAVFVLSRSSLWSVHHAGRVRTLSALVVVRTPRRPCSYSLGARCGPYATPAVFVLFRRSFGAGQGVGLGNVWLPPCGGVETVEVSSLMQCMITHHCSWAFPPACQSTCSCSRRQVMEYFSAALSTCVRPCFFLSSCLSAGLPVPAADDR